MRRIKIYDLKHQGSYLGTKVTVNGWVRTVREQKNFSFVEVNDGSTLTSLQVIIPQEMPDYRPVLDLLSTGCSTQIQGELKESPGKGQKMELHATSIRIIGPCDPETYPLQKKRHSFEFLRSIAHLRPRTNTIGAIARVRNALSFATHLFFRQKGFLYVHTPILTASDCEGAGELFRVTTLPPEKKDLSEDFFEKPTYLTVSGQMNAEIYALALSDVYSFGPTFRAENSNTSRHLAEFWMIEPEMAFADLNDDMDNAEQYLKFVLGQLLETCPEDMAFFDKYIANGLLDRIRQVIETPFERASYSYAMRVLEKSNKQFDYPVQWGADLQTEHERYLAEEYFNKPVIITDYPRDIKAFYMRLNDDEKTVAAMDILVPKVGEIVGGSQREERIDLLEVALKRVGLKPEGYWWYLELRKFGSAPHAGYGLGFERLVQFATGMENIRDVIPFPRTPGNIDF